MAQIAQSWRIEFMQPHPRLFDFMQDEPKDTFGYPLCQEGWQDVLERLCGRLEEALRDNETFEFVRIKQKFGILRIGWEDNVSEETRASIEEALALAAARSSCTCELCGAEGEKYHASEEVIVRCEKHAEGRPILETRANKRLHIVRVVAPTEPPVCILRHYDRKTDSFVGPPVDVDTPLHRAATQR
ncbi:hypothetical protein XH99_29575 [Bradyrhizobium nanningense]|uniref:Uncharacterized protein n=1 Tax=Bradyrhizobium nanningense TaxID=1325118 RepID=A0A4Q0RZU2_9BRAD|nr:hypothetical protein [Bradyrhizobium nanningense]RXH24212.1 hypothetical protein XH99_29575 [Bradyrhizobium nanningense]RXH29232.1 hypothetical protein XH84_22210 [Bradyrhizobium nanningense]